jgi:hypothetical protein
MENEKTTTENVNDNKDTKTTEKKEEVVDKSAIVEKVADELKSVVEKQQKEIAAYKEKLAKETAAKLEAAPEEIKAKYQGKEFDLKVIENIEKDVETHKAMEAKAKIEAAKEVEAYKREVFEKYGVKLPDATITTVKENTNNKVKNQNEDGKKSTRVSDLAGKEKLSIEDLKTITSSHEAMKNFMAERRKINS